MLSLHLWPWIVYLLHKKCNKREKQVFSYKRIHIVKLLLNCGVREDSWESLGLQGDPTSPFWRRSALGVLWKEWCWSWNSSTLATSCEELTHWKRPWCWEGLGAGGEGDDRAWAGWMASRTQESAHTRECGMRLLCMIIFGKCSMPKIGKEYLGKINVLTIK